MNKGPSVFTKSLNQSPILDTVAHRDPYVKAVDYTEICGECSVKTLNREFHCHLEPLSNLDNLDILIIVDSYAESRDLFLTEENRSSYNEEKIAKIAKAIEKSLQTIKTFYGEDLNLKYGLLTAIKCPKVNFLDEIGVKQLGKCSYYIKREIACIKPKLVLLTDYLSYKSVLGGSSDSRQGHIIKYDSNHIVYGYVNFSADTLKQGEDLSHVYLTSILSNSFVRVQQSIRERMMEVYPYPLLIETFNASSILDAKAALSSISSEQVVAVDIETTGLDPLTDKILSIAFASENDLISINWQEVERFPFVFNTIKFILEKEQIVKVFQNALFDIKFLERNGIKVFNIQDTRYLSHLEDENEPSSLSFIAKKHFPTYVNNI